ncbi:hypothetical protein [Terriglobus roseus]|nr:hypothetical protein [Terriglobus roseus]
MRFEGYLLLATLPLGLSGCKPDAAVEHGSTINSTTGTPSGQKNPGKTVVIPPKTDQSQPLNKVQKP